MSQAEIKKLIPNLRIIIERRHRNMKNREGPEGRLKQISKTITQLFKEERILLRFPQADESRGYAERLIAEAIKHGDTHKPTMEIADFYLRDKQMIHKLFKVFVPRYKDYEECYTNLYMAPTNYEKWHPIPQALFELKGNPFPSMRAERIPTRIWINNILLEEARREFNQKQTNSENEQKQTNSENES